MKIARRRVLIFLPFLMTAAGLLSVGVARLPLAGPWPHSHANRPTLLLLTSLPLVLGEDFSLHGSGSPALRSLKSRYNVVPISVANFSELEKGRFLLMAQPFPQDPENLVVLDEWVRNGGRLLLFADPMLEWPSKRPLGDVLRPAPMFMDTGLLAHWGLRLDTPEQRGSANRMLGGYKIETVSPGTLHGGCTLSPDRLVGYCRIGKGDVTIVADADLLDVGELGVGAADNLAGVLAELRRLEIIPIR